MITGETVKPEEAHRLGIVNRLFSAERLQEETNTYAQKLAAGATFAVGHIKQAVYKGMQMDLSEGLALERVLIKKLFESEDAEEGFSAFVEKRKAEFRGR